MVQVIPRIPSSFEKFSEAVTPAAESLGMMMGSNVRKQREAAELEKRRKSLSDVIGPEAANLPPEFQKMAYDAQLKQQQGTQDRLDEEQGYNTIKDTFGDKFANVWKHSPVGGRTKLLETAIDAAMRGENVENLLEKAQGPETEGLEQIPEKIPQLKNGKVSSDLKWPDFTKRPPGYTGKDWRDEKKAWRGENAPIFEKNKERLVTNKRDALGIKKLNNLNETHKVAEGAFERFLINPESGDFYGLAQIGNMISPEAQEWVKEIARFQNRAKDAFGSRVTNFDLQSYMKQFPGLLNTSEGRKRILRMMDINNRLDSMYDEGLDQVYKKYGLNGVPQEKADELAKKMIQEDTERLNNEYLGIDVQNQKAFEKQNQSQIPPQMIDRYLEAAGGDPDEAERMAREDGYEF